MFSNKNYLIKIIGIYFLINLIYFLFSLFIANHSSLNLNPDLEGYIQIHKKIDSYWYERIYDNGYQTITDEKQLGYHNSEKDYKLSEWAFFPLFVMILKVIGLPFSLTFGQSALIISAIFSILSFWSFFQICKLYFTSTDEAFFTTIVFICFPFHYHYSMFYTESVFLTLMLQAILNLYKQKYLLFSLFISLIVLVRPNGTFVILSLFFTFLEVSQIIINKKFRFENINLKTFKYSLAFLGAIASFALFLYFNYYKTGYLLAYMKAQVGWGRSATFPLLTFFKSFGFSDIVNSVYTIIVMFIGIKIWKNFPLSINILFWITILIPLSTGSTDSLPRFISILFPVFIIIGSYIYKMKYKYIIVACLFALQLILIKFWLFEARISY